MKPLVLALLLIGCAKPPTVTIKNTFNPGTNHLEGTVTFPVELKAGARVQVAYSDYRKGFEPDLEGANGMNSLDLPSGAKQLHFVITGLPDGEVTVFARAYSSETMAAMKAQLIEATETFKKTGKSSMAPNPPTDFAGFYTGTGVASLEGSAAKVLSPKAQVGIDFTLAAVDNSPPPPFSGTLTVKAVLKMKNKVRSYDDWDSALALLEKSLGKPTATNENRFSWGVVEGERCAYLYVERDERSKFFKDQTGLMVGTAMPPTATKQDDPRCLTASGAAPAP